MENGELGAWIGRGLSALGGALATILGRWLFLHQSAQKEYRQIRMVALQNCVGLIDLAVALERPDVSEPLSSKNGPSGTEPGDGVNACGDSLQVEIWKSKLKECVTPGVFMPPDLREDFEFLIRTAIRSSSAAQVVPQCSREFQSASEFLASLRHRCCERVNLDYGVPAGTALLRKFAQRVRSDY